MILSNNSILNAIREKRIELDPGLDEKDLRTAGIRIHLGKEVLVPRDGQTIDFEKPANPTYDSHDLALDPYCLRPGEFILASALERVKTDNGLIPVLDGRSTMARLGLTIHNSAALLDGRAGDWIRPVLEITNHGNFNILLKTGIPIGIIFFLQFDSPVFDDGHISPYANQNGTTGPQV